MAKKKPVPVIKKGNTSWTITFADLMSLLLCFFILLFSLSTVSEQKFEGVSISMANSVGTPENSESSENNGGKVISAGIFQLQGLDQYFRAIGGSLSGQTNSESMTSSGQKASLKDALSTLQSAMQEETSNMYDKTSDLSEQYHLEDYLELSLDSSYQYIQLTLKGSVLFDSGSAQIREESKSILIKIGKILKTFDGYHIEITGHTDNVPIDNSQFSDNNWLSSARALNAAEYLIQNCGIDPDYLKYSGRGEYEPIASNSTEEGRAKNRRIEIKIYNSYTNN